MRKLVYISLSFILITSCFNELKYRSQPITNVAITSIVQDSLLNIRSLEVGNNFLYYGSNDHLGRIALNKELKFNLNKLEVSNKINHYKNVLTYDGKPLHFRAVETVDGDFFGLSIANPARLYRLKRKSNKPELVYEENHESVFYDAMVFWNKKEGIAIGDPTDGCMSIIITRDGGATWNKLSCDQLPPAIDGEAAFAASDTNIAIVGDKTWVATGGMASRILYSWDKGVTWEAIDVPVIQGKSTTGLYSIDFYDAYLGFGFGGDYTQPNDSINNKIITKDGGKTWESIASGKAPGYRSCVQFVPNSEGKELVAVGFKGIDYSSDGGMNWIHLSDEGFYTLRFVNDTLAYAAGRGKISKLIFR